MNNRSEITRIIELACKEIRKEAPKPEPKTAHWNYREVQKKYTTTCMKLIKQASKKYNIPEKTLILIILK